MKVAAAPGMACPMEENPRKHISDSAEGVEVPDSVYYSRLLADGSLRIVPAATARKKEGKTDGQ